MLFSIWFRPRYKIPEFFTIAPVLSSTLTVYRWNSCDPSSLYIGLRVRYKYYKKQSFWFGLEPPTCRSRSKSAHSVFRTIIGVCKIFIQIGWDLAVRGSNTCFEVKTENGQAGLAVNIIPSIHARILNHYSWHNNSSSPITITIFRIFTGSILVFYRVSA